ncbi:hypothetical protein D9V60_02705 [Buchnera aphidicola (Aphis craccivora)]|uniref:Uncharacterized protein n=1 Tax=Buchnera aphidicola (Aphis craccivora) TaxID=466616 RepID=A0A4D6XV89_9GAMM|nr:hypothetical protein [Buchnera aphidicola]QCI16755.1 hypothetical protein D9V60_02705 [Buchnera aphidicola (Aphis craccivora)]QLL40887.1 hypothetical protein F3C69_02715 [Buchnera aphidicola (Aphis craccivore)]WAI17729.1 MAG: hypothetical protein OWM53_02715 [Buchnera aphidicola (Aphis craccivora)]
MKKNNKKFYLQKKYIKALKNKILLHQIEIKNIQENIKYLSKKLNYINLYINRLSGINRPPHY